MFSLRVIACFIVVMGFSVYAYRNWFVSLCAAVTLMAFMKHPDMPRNVAGIPGANLWNILVLNVMIAWWRQRRYEDQHVEIPRSIKVAFWLYIATVVIAFLRMFIDPTGYITYTRMDIFADFFVNSIRFLIPAYLLFDGCKNVERIRGALVSIVLLYFFLALMTIRYMGIHPDLTGAELSGRASKVLQRSIGFDRVDLGMMLAGACWAAIALSSMFEKFWMKWSVRGAALVILMGQALTGGRTGYGTWGVIGLVLCTLRWRKLLPLIPLAAIAVVLLVPSVAERMSFGFGSQQDGIVVHQNDYEITSGRSMIWPLVIDKIKESPILGYGRFAMQRVGLTDYIARVLNDSFPHPHEAYLEVLLDNGIVGFFCMMPIYFIFLKRSAGVFLDRSEPAYEAAGGAALALTLALMIAAFGAQTFYPRESVVGLWAAAGVALRVSVDRARRQEDSEYSESEEPSVEVEEPDPVGA